MIDFYINAVGERRESGEKNQDVIRPDFLKSGTAPRIGVLVNPLSGGNLKGLGEVRKVLADYPQVISRDVKTPEDISAALVEFARQKINLVTISGGDGTVQAALTALFHQRIFETLPLLTILQSGTTSMIAGDVGMRGSRQKNFRKLFTWAASRDGDPFIIQRPVLRVQIPGQGVHCGMFIGAAGIHDAISYCQRKMHSKGLKGEVGPGLTFLRFLWALVRKKSDFQASVPMTVALDDNPPQQLEGSFLLISTLERLLLGFHPFWGAETEPVHYTLLRAQARNMLRALPSILRGRAGRFATPQNGYFSHNVRQIRLNFDSGLLLDGQLFYPETSQDTILIENGGLASFLKF